eukprot:GHVH01016834.1.p1 GENE.GHVH01016834.1~~GHVH01016834.1.p1  ORF type:complete len:245 (-),score=20.39 GHVH01016834.1:74-808(-)
MKSQSQSLRRILKEYNDIKTQPPGSWTAYPTDLSDPKVWHFVFVGSNDSPYEGGLYHGRILLPDEYPLKAPNIIFDTQNGRFEVGRKICLSATAFHPENWQPAWGIRSLMEAVQAFMLTDDSVSVGAIATPDHERRRLAKQSVLHYCSICKLLNKDIANEYSLRATKQGPSDNKHVNGPSIIETKSLSYEERLKARTRPEEEVSGSASSPLGVSAYEGTRVLLSYYIKVKTVSSFPCHLSPLPD